MGDLKNGDNLKNEDDLKNEDNLKNKDNLKNEDDNRNEDNLKNDDNLKMYRTSKRRLCTILFFTNSVNLGDTLTTTAAVQPFFIVFLGSKKNIKRRETPLPRCSNSLSEVD